VETKYQRQGRLQAERKAVRELNRREAIKASNKRNAAQAKAIRDGERERRCLNWLIDDHNHDMDA